MKEKDRDSHNNNNRGYSTDQKISLESLQIQILTHEQTTNELNMIGLIAYEHAVGRQIDATELQ